MCYTEHSLPKAQQLNNNACSQLFSIVIFMTHTCVTMTRFLNMIWFHFDYKQIYL